MKVLLRLTVGGLALALLGSGCTSLSSRAVPYIGVPRYAASEPSQIEILHAEPTRPHDKLGEVVVDASVTPAPPVEKIEAAMRQRAAQMGADALVLVHDKTEPVGMVGMGPWWSPSYSAVQGRLIVAVAIKYR